MIPPLPAAWRRCLGDETARPYFRELEAFLQRESREAPVLPAPHSILRALELTRPSDVRVVLLGQDPYPTPGHAEGLCFSVPTGVAPPVSLRNVFRELADDLDCAPPATGHLEPWARQGVLLLNTVLTVRAGAAGSHRGRGWERFTDAVIRAVVRKRDPVVFLLWGAHAQAKAELVTEPRHTVLTAAHPSFFSARRGFFGSRPFSRTNQALLDAGRDPVDWCALG